MKAPIFQDPLHEEGFEGIAKLIKKKDFEHTFGGKKFETWLIQFEGRPDETVTREICMNHVIQDVNPIYEALKSLNIT